MKAKNGSRAPDFALEDMNGAIHQLSQYRGKKIILSFYRDASCPFCNLRIFEMSRYNKSLMKNNVVLLSVFHSQKKSVKKHMSRGDRPFPMLCDPKRSIYNLYEVHRSIPAILMSFFSVARLFKAFYNGFGPSLMAAKPWLPADILIDENLIVQDAFYSQDATSHIPMPRLVAFVKKSAPEGVVRHRDLSRLPGAVTQRLAPQYNRS